MDVALVKSKFGSLLAEAEIWSACCRSQRSCRGGVQSKAMKMEGRSLGKIYEGQFQGLVIIQVITKVTSTNLSRTNKFEFDS